jgi:hypothetical protein
LSASSNIESGASRRVTQKKAPDLEGTILPNGGEIPPPPAEGRHPSAGDAASVRREGLLLRAMCSNKFLVAGSLLALVAGGAVLAPLVRWAARKAMRAVGPPHDYGRGIPGRLPPPPPVPVGPALPALLGAAPAQAGVVGGSPPGLSIPDYSGRILYPPQPGGVLPFCRAGVAVRQVLTYNAAGQPKFMAAPLDANTENGPNRKYVPELHVFKVPYLNAVGWLNGHRAVLSEPHFEQALSHFNAFVSMGDVSVELPADTVAQLIKFWRTHVADKKQENVHLLFIKAAECTKELALTARAIDHIVCFAPMVAAMACAAPLGIGTDAESKRIALGGFSSARRTHHSLYNSAAFICHPNGEIVVQVVCAVGSLGLFLAASLLSRVYALTAYGLFRA